VTLGLTEHGGRHVYGHDLLCDRRQRETRHPRAAPDIDGTAQRGPDFQQLGDALDDEVMEARPGTSVEFTNNQLVQ
jgi:hypothetical protein